MTNLIDARKALNAELDSLRDKAEKIIGLLDALNAVDAGVMPKEERETSRVKPAPVKKFTPKKRAPQKAAPAKTEAAAPKQAAPVKKANGKALPDTGGTWFAELIEKPALRKDIFAAAVKKAGGNLTKDTTLQLSRRLDAALTKLVEKGSVNKAQTESGFTYSKA